MKVKDLMVPLADYATVSQDAVLFEVVLALESADEQFDQARYRHRAVLVYDARKEVIGKVSMLDVLRSLDPQYQDLGNIDMLTRFGLGPGLIKTMTKEFSLLQKPLDEICKKSARIRVRDIMHTPTKGEYVDEDASLNEAIHQLAIGLHQSLLVTRDGGIVGILRLTDVYRQITAMIKACEL